MEEEISVDPKIKTLSRFFLPRNRRIIKPILNRIRNNLWSEIENSKEFNIMFQNIALLNDEEKFTIANLIYIRLKSVGYPFEFDRWIDRLKISDRKIKIKLNDSIVKIIDEFIDKIIYKNTYYVNKYLLNNMITNDLPNNLNTQKYDDVSFYHYDKESITVNIIPDNGNLNSFKIFGYKSEYNFIEIQLNKKKLNLDLMKAVEYVKEHPDEDIKVFRFMPWTINQYILNAQKIKYFINNIVIIVNNNIDLEDLISERKINFIVFKDDLILAKPKCKMRIYSLTVGNCIIWSVNDNNLVDLEITTYNGYPIIGYNAYASTTKYGYFVNTRSKTFFNTFISMDKKYVFAIKLPKVNLNANGDENGYKFQV